MFNITLSSKSFPAGYFGLNSKKMAIKKNNKKKAFYQERRRSAHPAARPAMSTCKTCSNMRFHFCYKLPFHLLASDNDVPAVSFVMRTAGKTQSLQLGSVKDEIVHICIREDKNPSRRQSAPPPPTPPDPTQSAPLRNRGK